MNDGTLVAQDQFESQLAGANNISSTTPYRPGERLINVNGQSVSYKGPGLVTRDGQILRSGVSAYGQYYASRVQAQGGSGAGALGPDGQGGGSTYYYDLEQDPRMFYSVAPAQRNEMLNRLVQGGFLDKRAIGNFSAEIGAITEWLDYSNTLGLEANFALDEAITGGRGQVSSGVQARTYRTTSTEDLVRLSKKVAQDIIGRELTSDEAARFAQTYQSQEVAFQKGMYGGGTVQEPMSPDVAAQVFAEQAAPQEAAAYGYLGYMNKLFSALGVG